jgi:xanthine dehydrogenase molybdopterin-binding subunit B
LPTLSLLCNSGPIEGGMIQSTSWTLHEAVRFDRNGITSRDWSGYPILTMTEVPETSVTLLGRDQEKPLGAGEASQGRWQPRSPTPLPVQRAAAGATSRSPPERVKATLG